MQNSRFRLFLQPVFLAALIILAINDHVAKELYPSALTGKLSDFAGLFVLPVFIYSCLRRKHFSYGTLLFSVILSGLFFGLLQFEFTLNGYKYLIHQILGISPNLVADKTDLVALSILPVVYIYIVKTDRRGWELTDTDSSCYKKLEPAILSLTVCVLCATSFVGTTEKLIDRNLVGPKQKEEFLFRLEEEFLAEDFEITGRGVLPEEDILTMNLRFDHTVVDSVYSYSPSIDANLKFKITSESDSLKLLNLYITAFNFNIDSLNAELITETILQPVNKAIIKTKK